MGRRTRGKAKKEGRVLQTALNGRPRAGANRRQDGVGNSAQGHIFTPDGPKWTAQSGGGGRGENEGRTRGARHKSPDGPKWTARSVRGSRWGGGEGWGRGE